MKLKSITIKNFRCYQNSISVDFDDITTFIGKNDIGKSTVLEALEIFFNNDIVKITKEDANVYTDNKDVVIICDFCDLPNEIVIDSDSKTTLGKEFLTIQDDTLRIKKIFDCSKSKPSVDTFIIANHPQTEFAGSLLEMKEKELQKIVKERNLDVKLKGNPQMRQAIWNSYSDLKLQETEINVSKPKEDAKRIWENIEKYLPVYALFQSDRTSTDSDDEVQTPMKYAIATAIAEATAEIGAIQNKVQERAMEIANNTLSVLKNLDARVANEITPQFDAPNQTKWNSLFNVRMNTEDGIPLNKRGSGIRRMILVSFFKAEADRKTRVSTKKDVIYAIEEPETSMHPDYQEIIINSFKNLASLGNSQVILTTHSPNLSKELPADSIRFVTRDANGFPIIKKGNNILPEIVKTLGILPDLESIGKVQVIVCVEGPTDVIAIKSFNRCLHERYNDLVNIEDDKRVVIMPLGGSILKHWVSQNYLSKLDCKEVHIYDRDVPNYGDTIDNLKKRSDGSWGVQTQKYEIENYLHPKAIKEVYDVEIDTTQNNVPENFAKAISEKREFDGRMKSNRAKIYLSKVFEEAMTLDYLEEMDTCGEIKQWFEDITKMLH